MTDNSSRFFANRQCRHYPCHPGLDAGLNCLFCFCPLYVWADCGGSPVSGPDGKKDCSGCAWPHRPENYPTLLRRLAQLQATRPT